MALPKAKAKGATALIVEEEPIASALLQSKGFQIHVFHPRNITSSTMQSVTMQIKQSRYQLLWLDLPTSSKGLPTGRRPAAARQLANWIRTSTQCGVSCLLIGLRGRHWQDENLQNLIADKVITEATFHLCHFNIKVTENDDKPSSVQVHAYANFPIRPLRCMHPKATEHSYELKALGNGRAQLWTQAKRQLYEKLFAVWDAEGSIAVVAPLASEPDCPVTSGSTYNNSKLQERGVATAADTSAFPTEAKEAQKQRKKDGHIAKKKTKFVQDHHDDIGEDLSGLGPDVKLYLQDFDIETTSYHLDEADPVLEGLQLWFPLGCPEYNPIDTVLTQSSLERTFQFLLQPESGSIDFSESFDLCELCGGVGRPSQLAIRRHLKTGKNFDLVTGFDLGKPSDQKLVLQYIETCQVLVVIMAPSCRTLGPTSNLNHQINYDTWLRHYREDMPHVHFCARVASIQIRNNRYFFAENPWPTWLVHEGDWPKVLNHKSVVIVILHQCMLGQKGPNGLPSKKPTAAIGNSETIMSKFRGLQCDGKHQHDNNWGHGAHLHSQQVWPWKFAEHLIDGISDLIKLLKANRAYPTIGTGPQDETVPVSGNEPWLKCPGCKGRMARGRRVHTREPG